MDNTKQLKLTPAYIKRKKRVMMGVMKSRFPASTGRLAMNQVSQRALEGSEEGVGGAKGLKKGMESSSAMAARSLGAVMSEERRAK